MSPRNLKTNYLHTKHPYLITTRHVIIPAVFAQRDYALHDILMDFNGFKKSEDISVEESKAPSVIQNPLWLRISHPPFLFSLGASSDYPARDDSNINFNRWKEGLTIHWHLGVIWCPWKPEDNQQILLFTFSNLASWDTHKVSWCYEMSWALWNTLRASLFLR